MKIVSARSEEAKALTDIAVAAKRHWGYPEGWIRRWSDILTITPEYVEAHPTFVAVVDEKAVGFCALKIKSREALLDHLWVLPIFMGRGVGRALFAHAEEAARRVGVAEMKIVGDPHAEGFYRRMGAAVYGRESAEMEGEERYLPLFTKAL